VRWMRRFLGVKVRARGRHPDRGPVLARYGRNILMNQGMEQRIRFGAGGGAKSIACGVVGSGPPLLCSAWWVSHLQHDWEQARFRRFFSALAEHHTLVRYDRPGVGLSDRSSVDFTLATDLGSIEAVAAHPHLDRFALIGGSPRAPPSVPFA